MLVAPPLPHRRPATARLGPADADGFRVVKDRQRETYFRLGPEEAFLFEQFDRERAADEVCAAFQARFGSELTDADLAEFLTLAEANGLLERGAAPAAPAAPEPVAPPPVAAKRPSGQSLLRYRVTLMDPDRLFDWLAPRLDFLWSRTFVAMVFAAALAAAAVVWGGRDQFVSGFGHALRWESMAFLWAVLLAATFVHECAHGLTCKRHGGEVHEIGFLLIYLMPSLFCNVSDAWLIPRKRDRLYVTLAGGFIDLAMWSLAAVAWRLTAPESFGNYLALVVVTVVGTRLTLNMNPLIKLDGYYFLSDLWEMPNLHERATAVFMGRLRWLLWGAAKPEPQRGERGLLLYGAASWLFGVTLLTLTVLTFARFAADRFGPLGGLLVLGLSGFIARAMLAALFTGAAGVLAGKPARAAAWGVAGVTLAVAVMVGDWPDRAAGAFQLRAAVRTEARAGVSGFVAEVLVEEGQPVTAGQLLARLTVPNLRTRLNQNRAEERECLARLAMLEAGARPEEVAAATARAERAAAWRDLAARDLTRAREAFAHEMKHLDSTEQQAAREVDHARECLARAARLAAVGALADDTHREQARRLGQAESQRDQAREQGQARRAVGTRDAEAEVVRRERELAEARAALALLRAGARPEELEAERARLARVREEGAFLRTSEAKLDVRAAVAGVVTTPRMAERAGQYLREGEAVCWVEDVTVLEAEVVLPEAEAARVRPGQAVVLKPRDQPRRSVRAVVERVAPRAGKAEAGSGAAVAVQCRLDGDAAGLRPGASGHARIRCGERPLREVVADKALGLLRTEFWW